MKGKTACAHQCKCICHKEGKKVMHIVACCNGPCKLCGLNIKFGLMEEHLLKCHDIKS